MALMTKDKRFYKSMLTLTLTIALQNLVVFSVNLADNVMIGKYSEEALAGVALCNQIQFLLNMIVTGVCEGIVILASRAWGRRDLSPVKDITNTGLRLAMFLTGILFAAVFAFPEWVLGLLTNESSVIQAGTSYLRIVCFSYFFYTLTTILLASLRSVETVRIGFTVSLISLVVNVALNYCLIYGNLGFPCMGERGAALATVAARVVEMGIAAFYVLKIDKKLKLHFSDFFDRVQKGVPKSFLKVSWPMILSGSTWGIAMGIQSAILGHLGKSAISANSVATTLFQVLTVVAYGSANGTSVVIGKTIGEGRMDAVKSYAKSAQIIYLCIGILTGSAIFALKDLVLTFYNLTPETLEMARKFLVVLSVTSVGTAYQMPSLCGIVRGGGETDFVLYNDLIFMWLIVLPSSAIAAFWLKLDPVIVFICLKADQILKCFVAVVKVNRFKWIKKLDESHAN